MSLGKCLLIVIISSNMRNKSLIIGIFFFIGMLLCHAVKPSKEIINAAINGFAGAHGIDSTSVALSIVDLNSGETIASYNESLPLIPASIMKSVTIATLLRHAGIDYTYQTLLLTDGVKRDTILDGNLIIRGSGDPSLNSKAEPRSGDFAAECAAKLRQMGIKRIRGKIIPDESYLKGPSIPTSWMKGDLPHAYGTGSHAINFENNSSGNRSVASPADVLISRLTTLLNNSGISIVGDNTPSEGRTTQLLVHTSPPVDDIMRSCMMRSDNLFAEAMLRTFSKISQGDGSTSDGAQKETLFWKGRKMPMDGIRIVDGSGLSRSNRLTAKFLTSVLSEMSEDVNYASYFPLAGQEGTLRNFLAHTPLDSYIALKTGSMSGIQCYAGYKLDDEYAPTHAVVIIINNMPSNREAARKAASDLLLSIFAPTPSN